MSKEKAPAFQFYPRDFLTDARVRAMSDTEVGIYIKLICLCWLEGSLPANIEELAAMVRVPLPRFRKLWAGHIGQCFRTRKDGTLWQKRLERERRKQSAYAKGQSERGLKGAQARWGCHSAAIASPMPADSSSSATASSSAESKRKKERPDYQGQKFDLFPWQRVKLERIFTGAYEWAIEFDKRIAANGQTVPQDREQFWSWLLKQAEAEAKRRGATEAGTRQVWSLDVCRARGHGGTHGNQFRCDQQVALDQARAERPA